MAIYDNTHVWTQELSTRIKDLTVAGIPKYLIAKVVKLNEDTINKHYEYELSCSQAEAVQRIAKVVAVQAENGDSKAQALYLKTQGAKFGWIEKQVVENVSADDTQALKDKIKELEGKHDRDY